MCSSNLDLHGFGGFAGRFAVEFNSRKISNIGLIH